MANHNEEGPVWLLIVGIALCFTIVGALIGIPMIIVYCNYSGSVSSTFEDLQAQVEQNRRTSKRASKVQDRFPETIPIDLLPPEMEITYIDASGEKSVRLITTKEIEKAGRTIYIHAFCHERKAARTFKLSGIKKAVDTSTGEVIDLKTFRAAVK